MTITIASRTATKTPLMMSNGNRRSSVGDIAPNSATTRNVAKAQPTAPITMIGPNQLRNGVLPFAFGGEAESPVRAMAPV